MSQTNYISKEELAALKVKMNQKALAKKRTQKGFRLLVNILVAVVVLLPLLYAVSIAFMPSGELFTTELIKLLCACRITWGPG